MWFDHKPLQETRNPNPAEESRKDRLKRSPKRRTKRASKGDQPASTPSKVNGTDSAPKLDSPCEATESTVATEEDSLGSIEPEEEIHEEENPAQDSVSDNNMHTSLREIFPTDEAIREFFPNEESLREFFPTEEALREAFPTDDVLKAIFSTGTNEPEMDRPALQPADVYQPDAQSQEPDLPLVFATHAQPEHQPQRQCRRFSQPHQRQMLQAMQNAQSARNLVGNNKRRSSGGRFRRKKQQPVTATPVFDASSPVTPQCRRVLPGDNCNCTGACFCYGSQGQIR